MHEERRTGVGEAAAHPPVPPNCAMFSRLCPGVFCLNISGGTRINLDCGKKMDEDERYVVAAVACCAWNYEADRIRTNIIASVNLPAEVVDEMLACNPEAFPGAADEIRKARSNAEAWREWAKATR